jgi:hypothetical protein
MMPSQNRAGEIVEPNPAIPADISLTQPLCVVMPVARDLRAAALGTPDALWPTGQANKVETLGFVEQARQIDEGDHGSNLG